MGLPTRIIVPIVELRFHMRLALKTFPRFKMAILGRPHDQLKDATREELVDALTQGWEGWRIERPIFEEERANLPAIISMGRGILPEDSP